MTTPLQPYHFVTSAYCETQLSLYTLPCALLCSAAHPPSLCYAPSFTLPRNLHRSATSAHPLPHQASNLSTVIHTRTATPHYRSAHHYPPPSTKDTIAASTMHTRPTRYTRIIHPNSLLYVDIITLIHNRLQSYPQSTKQFYTTVDNVLHYG